MVHSFSDEKKAFFGLYKCLKHENPKFSTFFGYRGL
jgi:hypothetical protein